MNVNDKQTLIEIILIYCIKENMGRSDKDRFERKKKLAKIWLEIG